MTDLNSIAQSFKLDETRVITKIGLYFNFIDPVDNITIEIRPMVNGYPSSDTILTTGYLTNKTLYSATGLITNQVSFRNPVLVEEGKYYCFVVTSQNKNTTLWISRIGNYKLGTKVLVETQPDSGSCFTSQNGNTWTAQQTDDIKYQLFGALFKTTTGKIHFNSEPKSGIDKPKAYIQKRNIEQYMSLDPAPFESEIGSAFVRVYADNHGLNVNDKIHLTMFGQSGYSRIKVVLTGSDKFLFKGQTITSTTGSAIIRDVFNCPDCGSNIYFVNIDFINGYFTDNQAFSTNQLTETFYVPGAYKNIVRSGITGTIVSGFNISLNGFPQNNLIKLYHQVIAVDSINTFIINLGINASQSGRFGPTDVKLLTNFKYDLFNVSGHFISYNYNQKWNFIGLSHGQTGSGLSHQVIKDPKQININSDMFLDTPNNYFSDLNYATPSFQVYCDFSTSDVNNKKISPFFNLDSFHTELVSNQTPLSFLNRSVAPLSSTRYVDETDPKFGTNEYKYVTNTIQLLNDAVDLRIILDIYQDISAQFKLYIKKQSSDITSSIDDLPWTELTGFTKPITNSRTLDDKIEIDFVTNDSGILGWDGIQFQQFKMKIVGSATNSCKAPTFSNLRIIALT